MKKVSIKSQDYNRYYKQLILKKIGVVDKVIKEPLGGAHRDKKKALEEVKKSLLEEIIAFQKIDRQKIKKQRTDKYINMGSLSNL